MISCLSGYLLKNLGSVDRLKKENRNMNIIIKGIKLQLHVAHKPSVPYLCLCCFSRVKQPEKVLRLCTPRGIHAHTITWKCNDPAYRKGRVLLRDSMVIINENGGINAWRLN